jgi:hypothetical protein
VVDTVAQIRRASFRRFGCFDLRQGLDGSVSHAVGQKNPLLGMLDKLGTANREDRSIQKNNQKDPGP